MALDRLSLRWDGHEQAFVHRPSGAHLEGLIHAAKQHGIGWHIEYPDGRGARRCVFVLTPNRSRKAGR